MVDFSEMKGMRKQWIPGLSFSGRVGPVYEARYSG